MLVAVVVKLSKEIPHFLQIVGTVRPLGTTGAKIFPSIKI